MVKIVAAMCISKPHPAFISGVMQLAHRQVIQGWTVAGLELLPFIRNNAINITYKEEPEFTHLLFIDDDMTGFTAEHVLQLLEADKPIISGLIVSRQKPYRIISQLTDESPEQIKWHIEHESVLKEKHVGMAFTLIKREVLDKLKEPGDVWFTLDRSPRMNFSDEIQQLIENQEIPLAQKLIDCVTLGLTAHIGTELIGEDVAFCRRAEIFDFNSYTHCGVIVGHNGFTVQDHVREKIAKEFEDEVVPDDNLRLVSAE